MPTYTSQYPSAHSTTYVKATTARENYYPYYATDPTKSLIGSYVGNCWLTPVDTIANQRFHLDLGSEKIIRRIYYENVHSSGNIPERGVKDFTFWGSNTGAGTFDDLVWGNDGGWTELTVSQNTFDEHIGADQVDPKFIVVTNPVAYRYYAFKFATNHGGTYMGVRRIELQIQDGLEIKQLSESFSVADSILHRINLSEAFLVADSILHRINLSEAFLVTDNFIRNVTKALGESFSIADSKVVKMIKALGESFSIADSFTKGVTKNLSEAFSVVDSLVKNAIKQLAETWSLADSLVTSGIKYLTETLSVVDSFKRFFYNLYNKVSKSLSTYTKRNKDTSTYTKKDKERGEE